MVRRILLMFLLLLAVKNYSQEYNEYIVESFRLLNNYQIDSLKNYCDKQNLQSTTFHKLINFQSELIKNGEVIEDYLTKKDFTLINKNKYLKSLFELNSGDYLLNNTIGEDAYALRHYTNSLKLSTELNDTILICQALRRILFYESKFQRDLNQYKSYIELYKKHIHNKSEKNFFSLQNLIYKIAQKTENPKIIISKSEFADIYKEIHDENEILYANVIFIEALVEGRFSGNLAEAEKKYKEALSIFIKFKNIRRISERVFDCYLSLGIIKFIGGEPNNALHFFDIANNIKISKRKKRDLISLNNWISKSYEKIGDYKLAIQYLKVSNNIETDINQVTQNISISRFDNETLTTEKLLLEAESTRNKFWLIIAISSIILITIFGFFQLKNSKRKRLLAIQEKELATQKNLTILKEQEIKTINAMVEGQEKERKRVAEDLHDNLGSVIATLKLHFDNLRLNRKEQKIDQETLFDRTEGLIDDAYKKVRSIAHAKNAGVIANQGLLVAVKLMAEKISSANTIQIDVIDYGLEKPIENSFEISLFRIIQELTTNIIKHSQANHATINISQDVDDITILIEDNGIGMNTTQINLKKGMGLHSIKTRVEHLDGSFTIDSTPTKGTTIIINIPT